VLGTHRSRGLKLIGGKASLAARQSVASSTPTRFGINPLFASPDVERPLLL